MEYIGDKADLTYVCEDCGSDKIVEKVWVSVNDTIVKDKKSYSAYEGQASETDYYWCDKCCMEACAITMREYIDKEFYNED